MAVWQATWGDQDDVGKLQVADREECLNEGDACITGSNHNDSGILDDLGLREDSSGGETESEGRLDLVEWITFASINSVLDVLLLLLLCVLRHEPLMVPLSIQEVRESPRPNVDELREYSWNDGIHLDLKVEASLLRQSKQFLQDDSRRLLKDWIDARMEHF